MTSIEVLRRAAEQLREEAMNMRFIPTRHFTQRELCEACQNADCPREGYIWFCEFKGKASQ